MLQGIKIEALKDRSMNTLDSIKNEMSESRNIKSGIGEVRPEEMSLRKLRAQFKERVSRLLNPQPWFWFVMCGIEPPKCLKESGQEHTESFPSGMLKNSVLTYDQMMFLQIRQFEM